MTTPIIWKNRNPCKSKTEQRMVFRVIQEKDSPVTQEQIWSLDFLGQTWMKHSQSQTQNFTASFPTPGSNWTRIFDYPNWAPPKKITNSTPQTTCDSFHVPHPASTPLLWCQQGHQALFIFRCGVSEITAAQLLVALQPTGLGLCCASITHGEVPPGYFSP